MPRRPTTPRQCCNNADAIPCLQPPLLRSVGLQGQKAMTTTALIQEAMTMPIQQSASRWVGGRLVGAVAMTMTTVITAPPPTTDGGAMTADDGSDCRGSWDCGKARTTDVNYDPRGGKCHRTGVVEALDCGNGRGVAGAMTTTMTTRK